MMTSANATTEETTGENETQDRQIAANPQIRLN